MTTNHIKMSLSINGVTHEGLQLEAVKKGMDVPSVIQRVLAKHVTEAGFLEFSKAKRLEEFWWLVDEVVKQALIICDRDGPSSDITAKACTECAGDPAWCKRYEAYIGGPAFGKGNPEKGPVNREIGFRIRAALNAEVRTKPDGNSDSAKVQEGIIQTYSPFARVRGEAVA